MPGATLKHNHLGVTEKLIPNPDADQSAHSRQNNWPEQVV